MKPTVWTLQAKAGRRFRQGHPWVFANELSQSPKGHASGAPVELRDERGLLLARGYGNPNSLICFRTLTRDSQEPWTLDFLTELVLRAAKVREQLGIKNYSHRMVFGEADGLPGLIIDRFVTENQTAQVLVVQMLTAGIEFLLPDVPEWIGTWVEEVTGIAGESTSLVVRRDVGARKLEGLDIREPQIVHFGEEKFSLTRFPAWVRSGQRDSGINFSVDLVTGQKTGFFFDQATNIELLVAQLPRQMEKSFSVLDLFCYVGQWGTQVARAVKQAGGQAEVYLVDGSSPALALAKANAEAAGAAKAVTYERDIMEGLAGIPDADVVVCDPPAFIKSKKDHGAGLKGYLKVNAMALAKVKPGGWFVSCSCSHHLSEAEMMDVLRQAEIRAHRSVQWVAHGLQAPDHPVRFSFPEGQYLKCWIGRVE
jgi:23S rRNA (cytosine1962-C5)-methyltransferase